MSDLSEFLLARIAEDEQTAQAVLDRPVYFRQISWGWYDPDFGDFHPATDYAGPLPERVLAECDAKRQIVQRCLDLIASFGDWDAAVAVSAGGRVLWADVNRRERAHAHATLHALALPYSGHPEYDEAWRP